MSTWQIILISLTVLLNSLGQVLFKYASGKIDLDNNGIVSSFLLNPVLILALLVYAASTFSWLWVLKLTPLRIAYPISALAFIVVPIFAYTLLGESLRFSTFIGAIIIVFGVFVSLR